MTNWTDKLADQIRDTVALMLARRVKDPRLGFVTVTEVRVTGDGREATVFYTVLEGAGEDAAATAAALDSAKGLLRSAVAKKLGLKFAPTLVFVRDALPETSEAMEELLARVQTLDAELADRRVEGAYAGEVDPYRVPPGTDEELAEDTADA